MSLLIPFVLADRLDLHRDVYHGIYIGAVAGLFAAWAHDTNRSLREICARRWRFAAGLGLVFAGLSALIVLGTEDSTPHPGGIEYVAAIVWRGVLYGAADGLLLSAFPMLVVFAALGDSGLRRRRGGLVAVGALAMVASLVITATYHLGYSDFRSPSCASRSPATSSGACRHSPR